MNKSVKVWIYVFIWFVYIACISLYGEFVISKPMNEWLQYLLSFIVLIFSFYLFKATFNLILNSKFFKSKNHDNN
jgi:hypothetical protein